MSAAQWQLDPGLIQDSLAQPQAYDFFQLVHLYERWFLEKNRSQREVVGESIRFSNSLNIGFAPSQVEQLIPQYSEVSAGEEGRLERIELTPSFIGLLGLHGTLPLHYTEQVIKHLRDRRDDAGKALLDLFTNRAVSHFYKAWKKYRLPLHYETDRHNRYLPMILALGGVGFAGLRDRLRSGAGAVDDESIAYFTGLIRQRPVSAESLRRLLAGYFRENIRIEQFAGAWYVIPEAQRATLQGDALQLGVNTLVGERIWQRNLRLQVHIGPLTHRRYLAFLPGGELASALQKILALATSGQFEYEIRPILRARDVHTARLAASGCRLGYDSFLVCSRERNDRSDTRYFNQPLQ